jgi:ParB family chromosome partitioning protein
MEIALIENLQRKDLNALETAVAYQKLLDEFNLTQDQLAKRVGKSRQAIGNTMRLTNIIDEAKEALIDGRISEGHAKVLAGLPTGEQLAVLKQILDGKMNVREAEKASKEVIIGKHIRKVNVDLEVRDKVEKLQQYLGTKVEIKKSGGTGHFAIKFFSEEEFRSLYNKIMGN